MNPSVLADYVAERQLAAELGVHPYTLRKWRRLGGGPPPTKIGKAVLYRRSSVARWLEQRETASITSGAV